MALRERLVQGYVMDGDGLPITNARVKFKPTVPLGYTSTHVVVDREFEALTDNAGHFSRTLWCDEDSLVAINYIVQFPIANGGQADNAHVAAFSLAYQDGSAIDIGTLIAMGIPAPTPTELLYTSIDARIANALKSHNPDKPTNTELFRDDFTSNQIGSGWVPWNANSESEWTVAKSLLMGQEQVGNQTFGGFVRGVPAANQNSCTVVAKVHFIENTPQQFESGLSQCAFGIIFGRDAVSEFPANTVRQGRFFGFTTVGYQAFNYELNFLTDDFHSGDRQFILEDNDRNPPCYLKLYFNGATLCAYWSWDGINWKKSGLLVNNGGYPLAHFGFGMLNYDGTDVQVACDWIALYSGFVGIIGG